MLYGSFFDFLIIKRLKEQFRTIFEYIEDYALLYGVGLKRKDESVVGRKEKKEPEYMMIFRMWE